MRAQFEQEEQVAALARQTGGAYVMGDGAPLLTAIYSDFYFADASLFECAHALHARYALTLLGVLHALAAERSVPWRAAAFLPFVVSPVTVAFGLLLLYPSWTASLPLLLAAYAVLAYPFVAKSLSAGLDSLPPHMLHAARTLGASPQRTFWRVTLPLLRPALRGAWRLQPPRRWVSLR